VFCIVVVLVGAVGIENNTRWNFKNLEGMMGNAETLTRNKKELKEILIGPSMAPRFFELVKIRSTWVFPYRLMSHVGFGPKSCGADGKPKSRRIVNKVHSSADGTSSTVKGFRELKTQVLALACWCPGERQPVAHQYFRPH